MASSCEVFAPVAAVNTPNMMPPTDTTSQVAIASANDAIVRLPILPINADLSNRFPVKMPAISAVELTKNNFIPQTQSPGSAKHLTKQSLHHKQFYPNLGNWTPYHDVVTASIAVHCYI